MSKRQAPRPCTIMTKSSKGSIAFLRVYGDFAIYSKKIGRKLLKKESLITGNR